MASTEPLSSIVWVATFNGGNEHVDRQHRKLMTDINELTNLIFDGGAWPAIVAKSRELRQDSIEHFETEEEVLERAAYMRLPQHRADHRRLVQQLDDIVEHLAEVRQPSRTEIEAALYLRSMLLDHFFRKDIAYKSHLLMSRGA